MRAPAVFGKCGSKGQANQAKPGKHTYALLQKPGALISTEMEHGLHPFSGRSVLQWTHDSPVLVADPRDGRAELLIGSYDEAVSDPHVGPLCTFAPGSSGDG